jgi:hypothetical protein
VEVRVDGHHSWREEEAEGIAIAHRVLCSAALSRDLPNLPF